MNHLHVLNILCIFLHISCTFVICDLQATNNKGKKLIFTGTSRSKPSSRHSSFTRRQPYHFRKSVDVDSVDILQPSILIIPVSTNRRERQAVYDDFNPFSDVDETVSNAYTDIEQHKALEVAIDAVQAEKDVQAKDITALQGAEEGLKEQLQKVESQAQFAGRQTNLERLKGEALENRLIKELLLNKAQRKALSKETAKWRSAEAENRDNIRQILQLQAQLKRLRLNLGDTQSDCTLTPCLNGGVCLSKQPTGHECLCPNDYTGVNCQIPAYPNPGKKHAHSKSKPISTSDR